MNKINKQDCIKIYMNLWNNYYIANTHGHFFMKIDENINGVIAS